MSTFKTYYDFLKQVKTNESLFNEKSEWDSMVEIAESENINLSNLLKENENYEEPLHENKLSNFYSRYDHQVSFDFSDLCNKELDNSGVGNPMAVIRPSLIEDMDLVQISKRGKFQTWFKQIIKDNEIWNYSRGKVERKDKAYAFKFDMNENGISFILFYDRVDQGIKFFEDLVFNMIMNDGSLRELGKLYMNVSFMAAQCGNFLYRRLINIFRERQENK